MQFRVRPSSKKNVNNDHTIAEYPQKSFAETTLPKALNNRIDTLDSIQASFQELYRRERELANASYLQIQKRLDKLQYKAFSTEQDLRQLSEIREIKPIRDSYNSNPYHDTSRNEVMLLKQVILQDKQAHKDNIKHQNSLIEQLSLKQLRTEQELREIIAKQKMEYDYRLSGQGEQMREIEGLKQRKMQQQYEMMKGVIGNAERKIYQELQRKIRNETVVKDFVEEKLADLKQQLSNEHKQTITIQAKFIRETKQSLEHLFGLINALRKELGDELSQTQKLAVSNIKRLSMGLDIARQKTAEDVKQVSLVQQQFSHQIAELSSFITARLEENRQIISEFEEQAVQPQKGDSRVANNRESPTLDNEKLSFLQKDIYQWKALTEQKNLNVFKEISTTLKTMKLEWRKENDEMVSQIAALNQSFNNIKKSGPAELKKSVQAIITIFNNEFDVLAEQLQTLTEMIALSKKQTEKSNKEQLSRVHLQVVEQVKGMIMLRIKQWNVVVEKSMVRSEEAMKGFVAAQNKFVADSLGQRIQQLQNEMKKLQTLLKKSSLLTNAQLEEYSLKIKSFNDDYKDYLEQQRKEDLKKRVQLEDTMRKNASNLMDICYKKSEYLVDGLKNNLQISQMKERVEGQQALEIAKDELKKQLLTARGQLQKDLATHHQQLTKQRQSSEQIMHQAIEQSINNTKRNITNELGNNKLELLEKINQIAQQHIQTETHNQNAITTLKDQVEKALQQERKANEENIVKNKKDVEEKVGLMDRAEKDRELERDKQMSEMKDYLLQMIRDEKKLNEQSIINTKKDIQDKIALVQKDQQAKDIQAQQRSAAQQQQLSTFIKNTDHNIEDINQKILQLKGNVHKQTMKMEEEDKAKLAQAEKKISALNAQNQINYKALSEKLQALEKKINDLKTQSDTKIANAADQDKLKEAQMAKKIDGLALAIDNDKKQYKQTSKAIEEINQKIVGLASKGQQDKLDTKKAVGEESLKQLRLDLQKSMKELQGLVSELRANDHDEQHEEAISSIRKSVNKLQAMVFSQQAKNKAMFDRLTQDVKKVSQNLGVLTNEMRE